MSDISLDDIGEMLEFLHGHHDLTEWEEDFVESVYTQYYEYDNLSDRQADVLSNIYGKY